MRSPGVPAEQPGRGAGLAGAAAVRVAALAILPALVRQLASPAGQRRARALLDAARLDRLDRLPLGLMGDGERHPLAPAAVRVERTRGREAEHTAVTVWFRDPPALPLPGGGAEARSLRSQVLRVGAGLVGAAAVAAVSTAAARLAEPAARPRVVDAPAAPPPR